LRATKNEALYSWEEPPTTEHERVGARLRAIVATQDGTRAQARQPMRQHAEDDALWQRLRAQAEPEPRISGYAPAGTYVGWEQYAQSANDDDAQLPADEPEAYAPEAYAHQSTRHFSDEGVATERKVSKLGALAAVLGLLAAGGAAAYGESRASAMLIARPATTTPAVAGTSSFPMAQEAERAREIPAPEESPASSAHATATARAVEVPADVAGPEAGPRPVVTALQPEQTAPEIDVTRASERAERRKAKRAARRALSAQRAEGTSESEPGGGLSGVIDSSDDPLVGI